MIQTTQTLRRQTPSTKRWTPPPPITGNTGEVELAGDDIGGLAVHIAARVIDADRSDDIMVSSTVKDLVAGSGIEFEHRGDRELMGVPGERPLYAVSGIP